MGAGRLPVFRRRAIGVCLQAQYDSRMPSATTATEATPIGIGYYTVPEAARLLRMPPISIRRWLGGYAFRQNGKRVTMPPLWQPQLPAYDHHIELGFRDLIGKARSAAGSRAYWEAYRLAKAMAASCPS